MAVNYEGKSFMEVAPAFCWLGLGSMSIDYSNESL